MLDRLLVPLVVSSCFEKSGVERIVYLNLDVVLVVLVVVGLLDEVDRVLQALVLIIYGVSLCLIACWYPWCSAAALKSPE